MAVGGSIPSASRPKGGGATPEQVEEQIERQQAGPESRHGDARDADDAPDMVDGRVAMNGRLHAERDTDDRGDQQACQSELERAGRRCRKSSSTGRPVEELWPRSPRATPEI